MADWAVHGRPHCVAAVEAGIFKQGTILLHHPVCIKYFNFRSKIQMDHPALYRDSLRVDPPDKVALWELQKRGDRADVGGGGRGDGQALLQPLLPSAHDSGCRQELNHAT